MLVLRGLGGVVVIDEVQRCPELFAPLRVLADRPRGARFVVLGSAAPELLRQSSESLAGRITFYEIGGLAMDELERRDAGRLWLRGGFPRSLLARGDALNTAWRRDFVRTFVERDVAQLSLGIPAATRERDAVEPGRVVAGRSLNRKQSSSTAKPPMYREPNTHARDQSRP